MNAPTKTPEFAVRHPLLSRILIWPVVSVTVSVIFLSTVYVLGNFNQSPAPKKSQPTPTIALSAVANPSAN